MPRTHQIYQCKGLTRMTKQLVFLHTSPVHIATFDRLLGELAPEIPVQHLVDESLLQEARTTGITAQLAQRVTDRVVDALGADGAVMLCTCSTIGGCAEAVSQGTGRTVLRVDRAMAEKAVALGSHIVVVAALATTLSPTRHLLLEVAAAMDKPVQIDEVLCADAWAKFERGDQAGYLHAIAACLRDYAAKGDVIVLAQASMADAAKLCADLPVPILSSPRLGLEAAIEAYRRSSME